MIKTRKDLKFYLQEDGKRNGFVKAGIRYWVKLLVGYENAKAYSYLRALRHAEYHSGKKSLLNRIAYVFWQLKRTVRGNRYNIQIPINRCGYGLRIMHLSGGGGYFVECQ